jgi:hypothetical protein
MSSRKRLSEAALQSNNAFIISVKGEFLFRYK